MGIWHATFLGLASGKVTRYVLNSWQRWASYIGMCGPASTCLRKGIGRRGRERSWDRLLAEHTCSTTAWIAIWLGHSAKCRSPEQLHVDHCTDVLQWDSLQGAEFDLEVPLHRDWADVYCFIGCKVPSHLSVAIPLHVSKFELPPFLEHAEGNEIIHIAGVMQSLHDASCVQENQCEARLLLR